MDRLIIEGNKVNVFLKDNFKFSGILLEFDKDKLMLEDFKTKNKQIIFLSAIKNIEVLK